MKLLRLAVHERDTEAVRRSLELAVPFVSETESEAERLHDMDASFETLLVSNNVAVLD